MPNSARTSFKRSLNAPPNGRSTDRRPTWIRRPSKSLKTWKRRFRMWHDSSTFSDALPLPDAQPQPHPRAPAGLQHPLPHLQRRSQKHNFLLSLGLLVVCLNPNDALRVWVWVGRVYGNGCTHWGRPVSGNSSLIIPSSFRKPKENLTT